MNDQFHEERRTGIGGSDAAALCGKSPWATSADVYASKLGLVVPTPPNRLQEAGLRLEPVLASWYADQKGVKVVEPTEMLRHPDHPFMIAHVDRFIKNGSPDPLGILELKTTDVRFAYLWGEEQTDHVPDIYNIQVQHYMAVTGLQWCDIAVLIGGNDFRIYTVKRSDELIEALIQIEGDFWRDHVEAQVPPEIDGSESSTALLSALYPQHEERSIEAPDDLIEIIEQEISFRRQRKALDAGLRACQNKIKEKMALAEKMTFPGGRYLWRTGKEKTVIDYKGIVNHMGVPADVIKKFTTTEAGTRRFDPPRLKKEADE